MNLFDILGPVMVGPSSSHTAGAVKIGYVAKKLISEPIVKAEILLYGSFLATGKGHGTNIALVAGLLGMNPDDSRIPNSLEIAKEKGIELSFGEADLVDAHPNSVKLVLTGQNGTIMVIVGESIGGSRINIASIDEVTTNFSGEHPTLIVHNEDHPGHVADVTTILAKGKVNIATLQLHRQNRGGKAVMVLEVDQEIPKDLIEQLEKLDGISKVSYYSLEEE